MARFNLDEEDIDYENTKRTNWKRAKYTKRIYAENETKQLKKLKTGIIVLLFSTAAYLGYNSDFAQHFWDNVKQQVEENHLEEQRRADIISLGNDDEATTVANEVGDDR